MSEEELGAPFDLAAEVTGVERQVEIIRFALAGRLMTYLEEGITQPETEEIVAIRESLGRIATDMAEQASMINVRAFPVREETVSPDPTITDEEKQDITRRFVKSKIGEPFLMADLEERLRKNGVILPENASVRHRTLNAWLSNAQTELTESGENIRRVELQEGRKKLIVFAPFKTANDAVAKVVAPTVEKPPKKPAQRTTPKRTSARSKKQIEAKVTMSEDDRGMALAMLRALATSKHISTYLRPPEIARLASLQGFDRTEIQKEIVRLGRQLDSQRLVEMVTGRRKDPRPAFRLRSTAVKETIGTPDGVKRILKLLSENERFKEG